MIPGIDVSHWQREIDWGEVKRSGVKFAFIKATEFPDKRTSLFVDDELQKNIAGATANGIHWSAYHFFRTHIDPVIQAKVFCETVGDFGSLPPVMDIEAAGSKGERLNYKVRLFLEEIERISKRRPIIYTSGGFWRSYLAIEKRTHTDWARVYPLWIAQYTNLWPTPLYPWAGWEFWQYSDKGKIPGIVTHVDLNWFNGSIEDLQRKFVEGENFYPNRVEPLNDTGHDNLGTPVGEKTLPDSLLQNSYKGDFQEPPHQHRNIRPQKDVNHYGKQKNIQESGYIGREEEWIRSYFLQ